MRIGAQRGGCAYRMWRSQPGLKNAYERKKKKKGTLLLPGQAASLGHFLDQAVV